jgi:hypothetical protein
MTFKRIALLVLLTCSLAASGPNVAPARRDQYRRDTHRHRYCYLNPHDRHPTTFCKRRRAAPNFISSDILGRRRG